MRVKMLLAAKGHEVILLMWYTKVVLYMYTYVRTIDSNYTISLYIVTTVATKHSSYT